MNEVVKPPPDPLPVTLLLLTVSAGILDAVAYVGLGHVFSSLMTGNVALLGMAAAGLEGASVFRSIAALAGFGIGAAGGGWLANQMRESSHRRWLGSVMVLEAAALLGAVGFSLQYDFRTGNPSWALYAIILCTALAMGIRTATVLRLSVSNLKTTVLTLTIAGMAADSWFAGGVSPQLGRRVGSILALMLGAGVGVATLQSTNLWLPLTLAAGISIAATALYLLHPASLTVGWGSKS